MLRRIGGGTIGLTIGGLVAGLGGGIGGEQETSILTSMLGIPIMVCVGGLIPRL